MTKRGSEEVDGMDGDMQAIILFEEGCRALRRGNPSAAASSLDRALALSPSDTEVRAKRAEARMALDQWTGAVEDSRAVCEGRPDWMLGHLLLGKSLRRIGRIYEAFVSLRKAQQLAKESEAKDVSSAMDEISYEAVGAANQERESGIQVLRGGDYDAAVKHFSRGLLMNSEDSQLWNKRCAAHLSRSKWDLALRDARQLLRLRPDWAKSYHRNAIAFRGLGRMNDAISILEKGLDRMPENRDLMKWLDDLRDAVRDRRDDVLAKDTQKYGGDCAICGKIGHKATECPQKRKPTTLSGDQCFICEGFGHKSRDCPRQIHNFLKKIGAAPTVAHIQCRYCGKRGHQSRDCTERSMPIHYN